MVALTLCGLKPIIDGHRIVNDTPRAEGQAFDQELNFAQTRACETGVESIPQIIMQALALGYRNVLCDWSGSNHGERSAR